MNGDPHQQEARNIRRKPTQNGGIMRFRHHREEADGTGHHPIDDAIAHRSDTGAGHHHRQGDIFLAVTDIQRATRTEAANGMTQDDGATEDGAHHSNAARNDE